MDGLGGVGCASGPASWLPTRARSPAPGGWCAVVACRGDPDQVDQRRQPGFDRAALSRLAGAIDGMIGVDPHRDTLAAAATDVVGGLLAQTSVTADAAGYRRLLDFARAQGPVGAVGRWKVLAAMALG
jgi:hypothetical protein